MLLKKQTYLAEDGRITEDGYAVMEPYKMKNAIILAAGFASRCAPLSYERPKGLFVITDGKRNDIGSTMECYAKAHLGTVDVCGTQCVPFGADALTVNGYLGSDGINPLLDICELEGKTEGDYVYADITEYAKKQATKLQNGTATFAFVIAGVNFEGENDIFRVEADYSTNTDEESVARMLVYSGKSVHIICNEATNGRPYDVSVIYFCRSQVNVFVN